MAKAGHVFDGYYKSNTVSNASDAAAAVPVQVHFETRGLVIEHAGGERAIWPFASISTRSVVSPGTASNIVLTSATDPGSKLSVADAEFTRSIVQAAPGLRPAPVGPSWLPMVWASLATVALIGGLIWGLVGLFPYKAVARRIPDDTRAKIGELAQIGRAHV